MDSLSQLIGILEGLTEYQVIFLSHNLMYQKRVFI